MKIYGLTDLGKRLARSTNSPDTDAWRIVHFLDRVDSATSDQIAEGARAPGATGQLAILERKQVVKEIGGGRMDF